MSRNRLLVVVGLLVIFFVAGGILIYVNGHKGGVARTFNLTVSGATTMSPDTLNANLNDTITINITSDTDGEVHLHDYDIAFETKVGQVVTHTFKADRTCTCDIEWESTSHQLGTLYVNP